MTPSDSIHTLFKALDFKEINENKTMELNSTILVPNASSGPSSAYSSEATFEENSSVCNTAAGSELVMQHGSVEASRLVAGNVASPDTMDTSVASDGTSTKTVAANHSEADQESLTSKLPDTAQELTTDRTREQILQRVESNHGDGQSDKAVESHQPQQHLITSSGLSSDYLTEDKAMCPQEQLYLPGCGLHMHCAAEGALQSPIHHKDDCTTSDYVSDTFSMIEPQSTDQSVYFSSLLPMLEVDDNDTVCNISSLVLGKCSDSVHKQSVQVCPSSIPPSDYIEEPAGILPSTALWQEGSDSGLATCCSSGYATNPDFSTSDDTPNSELCPDSPPCMTFSSSYMHEAHLPTTAPQVKPLADNSSGYVVIPIHFSSVDDMKQDYKCDCKNVESDSVCESFTVCHVSASTNTDNNGLSPDCLDSSDGTVTMETLNSKTSDGNNSDYITLPDVSTQSIICIDGMPHTD